MSSEEKVLEDKAFEIYKRLNKNMGLFGKMLAPAAFSAKIPDFHTKGGIQGNDIGIYDALLDKTQRRMAIAAPRAHSKTMLATKVNTIYHIMYKRTDEVLPILLISESEGQAINYLYDIKQMLEQSELINTVFAKVWGFRFDEESSPKWTETSIILPNKSKIVVKGTRQKIRGVNYLNVRPKLIVLDDFESEHNTESIEMVRKNRKWVTNAVIPALADKGRIVVIGNMVADNCFLAWIKKNPAWKVLWFQAIDDDWKEPLWKDRFPITRLKEIKKYDYEMMDNPFGFYREYMNVAIPESARSILPKDIRYLDDEVVLDWIEGIPCLIFSDNDTRAINLFIGVDPAPGVFKDKGDHFVCLIIGIDSKNRVYVLEYIRERIEVNQQAESIVSMYLQYRQTVERTTIETTGYQESLRSVVNDMCDNKKIYISGLEKGVKPRQQKSSRHDKIVGLTKVGRLFIKKDMEALRTEMLSVHNTKRSPDVLDALWNALWHSYPYMGDEIVNGEIKVKEIIDEEEDWKTI